MRPVVENLASVFAAVLVSRTFAEFLLKPGIVLNHRMSGVVLRENPDIRF